MKTMIAKYITGPACIVALLAFASPMTALADEEVRGYLKPSLEHGIVRYDCENLPEPEHDGEIFCEVTIRFMGSNGVVQTRKLLFQEGDTYYPPSHVIGSSCTITETWWP